MNQLKNKIDSAMSRIKADLVLKNASYINVYTQTIDQGDIAIKDDTIIGIGEYKGMKEIDCSGIYISPGFIDGHVHIESSMVTPEVFSQLVIKNGVTSVVADPHEIANVLGIEGIKLMLENSEKALIDIYFMLPSCVPAVDFEDNGATLKAQQLSELINHPKILGLGEVMDVHAVTDGNSDMLEKLKLTKQIDGHCPQITNKQLNAYLTAGIKTDHECTDYKEALEKVKYGMHVMLREGSAAKDLIHLLPAVNDDNYQRFLFCTDDRHIEDLVEEGSIDHCIRLAIKNGLEPIKAYTMATLNAANCFGLTNHGAIAPGMKANLVLFRDLKELKILTVIKNGRVVESTKTHSTINAENTMHVDDVDEKTFQVEGKKGQIYVIKAHPGSLTTTRVVRKVKVKNNLITKVIEEKETINKITVIERHKKTGKYFTGYIEGIGLKKAAIAQSIAHDSHNIIVVGDNDLDMQVACSRLIEQKGGIVFASKGEVEASIALPIAGIITHEDPFIVNDKVKKLNHLARKHGIKKEVDPFITLGFMALPVIPDIKITPRGLFYYHDFKFIDLFVD